MKYDDASWHYGGKFPEDLPTGAGATHMGMLIAWLFLNGFSTQDDPIDFDGLTSRTQTPGEFVMNDLDEKFVDIFLSEEGNAFVQSYFQSATAQYMDDYTSILVKDLPTEYHVADTWENYDLLKPAIDQRYSDWKNQSHPTSQPKKGFLQRLLDRFSK